MPTQLRDPWPRVELHCAGVTLGNEGRCSRPNKGQCGQAAFPNDTNGDGDGPTWIQTATSADMHKKREGHQPQTLSHTREQGRQAALARNPHGIQR
jgi:hypothetical protein